MPSGPSLLNDSDSVQIAPVGALAGCSCPSRCRARDGSAPAPRSVARSSRRSGTRTGRPCARRGATAGDRSSCAAGRRVHVGAAEEVGLHVHLLDLQLARDDLLVHPLVARVEAARVAAHRDQAGLLLRSAPALSASSSVSASGISTCTCLPARITCSPWRHASASAWTGSPRRRARCLRPGRW